MTFESSNFATEVVIIITLFFCRYLYECLYSWLISALSRADSFMLEQDAITGGPESGQNNPCLKVAVGRQSSPSRGSG